MGFIKLCKKENAYLHTLQKQIKALQLETEVLYSIHKKLNLLYIRIRS